MLQLASPHCSTHTDSHMRVFIRKCANLGVIFLLVVGAAEWVTPSLQEKIAKTPGLLQSECSTQSQLDIH